MGSKLTRESHHSPAGSHGVRGDRTRRRLTTVITFGSLLLTAWLIGGFLLYVHPEVDPPERSDAVVVLAPAISTGRLDYAESLMARDYSETLVISVPDAQSGNFLTNICGTNRPYRVICFSPDPITTQGEARAIQRLGEENAWGSITVVTNDFHVTRARTIIERCYSPKLNMVAVRNNKSLTDWAYRFAYESAAFVKAVLHRDC